MPDNLKQLLAQRSAWFAREIVKSERSRPDYALLTPAQSRLLAHMGRRPTHMAMLARRLAISRQAVHKTVGELVRKGILELQVDPRRRGSRLVAYTARGLEADRAGAGIIAEAEARIAGKIGRHEFETLCHLLARDWD